MATCSSILPGESYGQRNLVGYVLQGYKDQSDLACSHAEQVLSKSFSPPSRLKKEPELRDRDAKGLNNWGGELACLKQGPRVAPHCLQQTADWSQQQLCFQGQGEGKSYRIDVSCAHQLPGKPAEEHGPHHPFDTLTWWRCSDLTLEQYLAGARGKYTGRSLCKQGVGEAGTAKLGLQTEQENRLLLWLDHTYV